MASDGVPKVFSLKEVEQHVAQDDCWMIIHGKVYDVTTFMDDHPGGDDVLLQTAGKDASEEFDDVGHSKSAIEQLKDFYVGECSEVLEKKLESVTDAKPAAKDPPTSTNGAGFYSKILQFLVPLMLLGVAVALRKYSKKTADAKY
ncbi:cytochrome b5 isoform X2 [Physcomitrium patens]|nr:hypothetical protein PHYPA_026774 [Physcomitrium patens]